MLFKNKNRDNIFDYIMDFITWILIFPVMIFFTILLFMSIFHLIF